MAKGTEKALGLLGSSLMHSGSQASLSLWEPRKRTLDALAQSRSRATAAHSDTNDDDNGSS